MSFDHIAYTVNGVDKRWFRLIRLDFCAQITDMRSNEVRVSSPLWILPDGVKKFAYGVSMVRTRHKSMQQLVFCRSQLNCLFRWCCHLKRVRVEVHFPYRDSLHRRFTG